MPASRNTDPSDGLAIEHERRIRLADGRTLAYLDWGGSRDSTVMYFHGYPGSRLEGRLAAGAAQRLGLRLIAPDRPGFGESTFQRGRTIGAWAGDVADLADQLGLERFAVVGASGGGPYALACAARIPERLSGVALVCPLGPAARTDSRRGMIALNRLALALAARSPPLARLAVGMAAPWVRRHTERYVARMAASAPAADRRVLADSRYRELIVASTAEALRRGGRGAAWELTLLARPWDFSLREVYMPVRIWQGLADNIVPAATARHLAAALAHAESHYLEGEGHLSLMVRHINAVLDDLCARSGGVISTTHTELPSAGTVE